MRSGPRAVVAGLLAVLGLLSVPLPRAEEDRGPAASAPLPARPEESTDPLADARIRGYVTLADCLRTAVRRNERIGRAEEDLRQARLVKTTARGTILPRVTLEDNYYRQNEVTLTLPAGGGTTQAFSFADSRNQLLLRLEQPIFGGFRDYNFVAYANRNIEAFRHRREDAERVLYGSVAQAFYSALQKEGEVKTLEDSVGVERERFREIQARHEAGLARKTEVLLVQSQLAEDESRLLRARNDFQVAREQLAFLLAGPLNLPLRDDVSLPEIPSGEPQPGAGALPLEALVREAAANRSDLKERDKAVEAARYQVAVARGEYYPTLNLAATAILDRKNYSEFAQETDWTAELNLSLPLFDGGRIRARVATAQSKLRQAVLDREELARQVELEVQSAWLTLHSDAAQLKTLEASVVSADENHRLLQEEYRSGLATNLEVITGHNQLLSARLDLDRQRYQVRLDWVALKLVQGRVPGIEGSQEPWVPRPDIGSSALR